MRALMIDDHPASEAALLAFRRAGGVYWESPRTLTVRGLALRVDTREASYDARTCRLSGKECAVLELLILRAGYVVGRQSLLDWLYGDGEEPASRVIDVFVCHLRGKLARLGGLVDGRGLARGGGWRGNDGPERLIEAVRGNGFIIRRAAEATF